ncbi:MAG: YicC/YloC family endoribonuclease [Gammaproteobacteria bacterium]
MIKSMTAFAGNEAETGNLTIDCEMRSVNHRYSDVTVKLPECVRFLENEIRSVVASGIQRGKVDCSLSYKARAKSGLDISINRDALASLLAATKQIEEQMAAPLPFSALEVLAYPGILQESDEDQGALARAITELVERTLAQLMEVRIREGAQLKKLIEERCVKMRHHVAEARVRMPEVLQLFRSRLKDRMAEAVAEPDNDRLEQELVLIAQKLDIAEELDRLDTHLIEVQRVLEHNEPAGRRLDFLMQELHREANTLGSKSADSEMTRISIELKVLIEQMREQVQNIE